MMKNGRFVDYSEELEDAWDKQQPLKVSEICGWLSCPSCSKDICGVDDSEVYSILDSYCNKCGQKLEW